MISLQMSHLIHWPSAIWTLLARPSEPSVLRLNQGNYSSWGGGAPPPPPPLPRAGGVQPPPQAPPPRLRPHQPERGHRGLKVRGELPPLTGHAGERDHVDEPPAPARDEPD